MICLIMTLLEKYHPLDESDVCNPEARGSWIPVIRVFMIGELIMEVLVVYCLVTGVQIS